MAKKGIINRRLKASENYSGKPLEKGHVVYLYINYTYNCIGKDGIAVSEKPDETPFYEVPKDSVDWEK